MSMNSVIEHNKGPFLTNSIAIQQFRSVLRPIVDWEARENKNKNKDLSI